MFFARFGFVYVWELLPPFSPFLLLVMDLFHNFILGVHNSFGFTGSQLERNFPQGESYLECNYLIQMIFKLDFNLET